MIGFRIFFSIGGGGGGEKKLFFFFPKYFLLKRSLFLLIIKGSNLFKNEDLQQGCGIRDVLKGFGTCNSTVGVLAFTPSNLW